MSAKPIQRKYIEEYRIVRARDAQEKYPHLVKTDMDAKSQMLWLNDKELREYSDEIVKQQIRNRDGKRYVNDTTALDDGEEGVHIEDLLHAYRAERDEPNKLPEIQKYGRITNSHIIISNVLRKTATWNHCRRERPWIGSNCTFRAHAYSGFHSLWHLWMVAPG